MFTGFTDATVDFLWGIRFNNERPWFEAHKETYLSELYRPMKDLGAEIYEFLSEQRQNDPMVCRVSRIYRGARRLRFRSLPRRSKRRVPSTLANRVSSVPMPTLVPGWILVPR